MVYEFYIRTVVHTGAEHTEVPYDQAVEALQAGHRVYFIGKVTEYWCSPKDRSQCMYLVVKGGSSVQMPEFWVHDRNFMSYGAYVVTPAGDICVTTLQMGERLTIAELEHINVVMGQVEVELMDRD